MIKKILLVISVIVYFFMAGLAGSLASVGHTSVLLVLVLPFVIFPAMVMRNISLYGIKRLHILITPLIFIGTLFTTSFMSVSLGYKTVTQTVDGITYDNEVSVYDSLHLPFKEFEFLILFTVFFLSVNVFRFGWFAKVP